MKKATVLFLCLMLSGVFFVAPAYSLTYAWVKYDGFNSGAIDPLKWDIDNSSANITVENGRAKFEHLPDIPGDSAWLIPKKGITNIRGIRTTVTFQDCSFSDDSKRDVAARIAAYVGKEEAYPNNIDFTSLAVVPYFQNDNSPRIYGETNVLNTNLPSSDPNFMVEQLYFGSFPRKTGMLARDVMGIPLILTAEWTSGRVKYNVSKQGRATYKFDPSRLTKPIIDPQKAFVGIGTRSNVGAGTCTVYFDDVYFLRKR